MSKKPYLLIVLLLSAFSLTSLTGMAHGVLPDLQYRSSKQLTDTGGRIVSLDSAQQCINRYAALMAAHGFSAQAGQNINIRLRKTEKITTGETFDGQALLNWLNTTDAAYKAAGKKLMVKIQLGVYDNNYLNTYQTSAALRAANKNRVAIFIIPYDGVSGQPVSALSGLPTTTGGTGGGSGGGFDLGGVQP